MRRPKTIQPAMPVRVGAINPPIAPPMIRDSFPGALGLTSEFVLDVAVGSGRGKVEIDGSFVEIPMAELNTSIAASWPHGNIEGTGGPCHLGVYQLVSWNLAFCTRELNYTMIC